MERIEMVDEALFVENGNALLADKNEFRMGNDELLPVSGANGKGAKSTAQPLFEFLHVHTWNLREP